MATTIAGSICAEVRKGDMEEDRISQMPDEILIAILSLLHFVEATNTCVLSKRWKYLWTSVGCLTFDVQKKLMGVQKKPKSEFVEFKRAEYTSWVNRVLLLHQGSHINEFRVNFPLERNHSRDIDQWIRFAIMKRVQRLELDLQGSIVGFTNPFPFRSPNYTFPNDLYYHIKSPCGLSCIRYLTQLSLKFVNVTGELVEHFLYNCPLLERLWVSGSEDLLKLKVVGPSLCLKSLEISHCSFLERVDIYAPALVSFICLGIDERTRIIISHAPLLVNVTYGMPMSYSVDAVSSHFSQLERLTLCVDFSLGMHRFPHFPELNNLKSLTLQVLASENISFLDCTSLIERSPLLRIFTLQFLVTRKRGFIKKPSKCLLHKCLKVVEFVGNVDMELAMYLLQNAIALEKIVIKGRLERIENMWTEELRKRAAKLKRERPLEVKLVSDGDKWRPSPKVYKWRKRVPSRAELVMARLFSEDASSFWELA